MNVGASDQIEVLISGRSYQFNQVRIQAELGRQPSPLEVAVGLNLFNSTTAYNKEITDPYCVIGELHGLGRGGAENLKQTAYVADWMVPALEYMTSKLSLKMRAAGEIWAPISTRLSTAEKVPGLPARPHLVRFM